MENSCTILGVGNTLWADEGVGPKLVEIMGQRFDIPEADMIDGGTQGLYLLPVVTAASNLLLFDAVKLGRAPGTVVVLENDQIEAVFGSRILSLHQTSLRDLLAAAKLIGWQPQHVVLIGVEVEDTENWGGTLTAPVAGALDEALARAQEIVEGWGLSVRRREKTDA